MSWQVTMNSNSRILLVPDAPGWALDRNARDLVKYNKTSLQLDIAYFDDVRQNPQEYFKQYDLLFPMYMRIFFDLLKQGAPGNKMITGIRSYHSWDKKKTVPPGYNVVPGRPVIRQLKKAVLINTHAKKLWHLFSRYLPVVHTKYTVDFDNFFPEPTPVESKLRVGWAGSLTNHGDKRGFHEFIKPACEAFPDIELKLQTREDNPVDNDRGMRDFYNSLDLYIIASRSEGTPRPVLEAAACGVPVITTDVGIVPELIRNGDNGFIIERTLPAFKEQLQKILHQREQLPAMGNKLRKRMEDEFDWRHLIVQWTDFFHYALELQRLDREGQL